MSTLDAPDETLRTQALEQLRKRSEFRTHLVAYVLVNAAIVVFWFVVGGGFFWPVFPLFGWAIGLFFHGWDTFRRPPSEDQIRQEMRRLDSSRT